MNMRTLFTGVFGFVLLAAGCAAPEDVADETQALHGAPSPDAKVHWQRDAHKGGGGGSALMTYHGGSVLTTNKTMAVFWGSQWSATSFQGDKVTGLDSFFSGMSGSKIEGVASEYSGIQNSSQYLGHTFDLSAAPNGAPTTSQAVAEACKVTNNAPDPSAIYFLYTSTGAGHVSYCAWHSYGNCSNGAAVQVAYMPNIDGLAGCDPQDTWTTHSQGLAALANVTSHEMIEAITDPRNGGWYDGAGSEIGDKCAWSFHSVETLANGSQWKLQMEWSNNAYSTNTGYPNTSGQNGCLM